MIFLTAALAAFILTSLMIPLTIKLALKYQLVDNPKLRPHPAHVQKRTVPRAGGVPIFLAILISSLLFVPLDKHILGIFLGIFVLLIMGLLDDYFPNFSPTRRLILQFCA